MSNPGKDLLRVELHLHTCYSKDSLVKPDALLQYCKRHGIDRVAITDHNVIEGALAAKALDPERVIVGEEIQTSSGGEIIGYYMTEWVPPGLSPIETISRLRDQGAVISIPHPFDTHRGPQWREDDLLAIAAQVDAIEVFNARCLSDVPNARAKAFAESQGLLQTVGSDAHSLREVGRATLVMERFEGPEAFKVSLKSAEQDVRLSPASVHFYSRYAVLAKRIQRLIGDEI